MPHVRSVAVGIWMGTGSRQEVARGERHLALHRAHGVQGHDDPLGRGHRAFGGLHRRPPRRLHRQGDGQLQRQGAGRASAARPRHPLGPCAAPAVSRGETSRRKRASCWKNSRWRPTTRSTWSTRSSPATSGRTIRSASPFWARARRSSGSPGRRSRATTGSSTCPRTSPSRPRAIWSTRDCCNLSRARFETLPPNGSVPPSPVPSTHARLSLRHKKSLEQVHLCLGVPCYPLPHEKRYAYAVLNTVLGGGMSSAGCSRTSARSAAWPTPCSPRSRAYRDTGCLSVYAGTSRESTREVVRLILEEFRRLKQERSSGRGTAPGQGQPERVAAVGAGVHAEPHGEPGPPVSLLRPLLHAGRIGRPHRAGHRGRSPADGPGRSSTAGTSRWPSSATSRASRSPAKTWSADPGLLQGTLIEF